jgi:uncharacterized protein
MTRDWSFLLDQLATEVSGINHAIAVSGDGLLIAASRRLPRAHADQLSAFTSGVCSLTNGAAKLMGADPVEQTIVEMADGYLIVMAIGDGSILTVLAVKDCELGQVSYEMAMLINRVGATLTPAPRSALRA